MEFQVSQLASKLGWSYLNISFLKDMTDGCEIQASYWIETASLMKIIFSIEDFGTMSQLISDEVSLISIMITVWLALIKKKKRARDTVFTCLETFDHPRLTDCSKK